MPTHGRPMRAGHKRPDTTHVIHEDGTWSNNPTVEVVPIEVAPKHPRPLGGEIFKTAHGQYICMGELEWGIYVYDYPHNYQPRIEDCTFWDWEQYEKEMG